MTTAQIDIPDKLIPVFDGPADVRGAYGGRGSAKTRSFATMILVRGYQYGMNGVSGQMLCARQYMNSLADSSLEELKRSIEDHPFLAAYYDVGETYIKSRDGRISFAFAGLDRNIASIKSKGRILICWIDEAEPVTDSAFDTLIPTLREEGGKGVEAWNAELWVTWNPKRKKAAVERRFRFTQDPLVKVVQLNWRDNPKFPAKLERDRLRDKEENADQYDHIWEGDYVGVVAGAYFAKHITAAKAEGRISRVGPDPLMSFRVFCDIGGTGARADAFTMWVCQFIGKELRVLNHYESVGQPAATHFQWLRDGGYTGANSTIWLPHDGDTQDKVFDVSYKKAFEGAGYPVEVVPNQGKGAAMLRVKSAQRVFPSMWINKETTEGGMEAVGWYHEKQDEKREIGLGPEHDWSSHSADSFGLMCVVFESQGAVVAAKPINYGRSRYVA
ncbi:phage terminase large subunit [uncultured Rhodoferax sp.]|uniref:PBSX family phage terminase large subunit n=1 Tax=uncultured Rhodoferax sp. TaxID=223188 RepID=UPI0025D28345|nr:phage terminase large subunit [uncultured Rhodoferax sp.]